MSKQAGDEVTIALAMLIIKQRLLEGHDSVEDACNVMYDVLQPLNVSKVPIKGTVPRQLMHENTRVEEINSFSKMIECFTALKFVCGSNNSLLNLQHVYFLTYEVEFISPHIFIGVSLSQVRHLFSLVTDTVIYIFRHEVNLRVMTYKCKGLLKVYAKVLTNLNVVAENNDVGTELMECVYPHLCIRVMLRIVLKELGIKENKNYLIEYLRCEELPESGTETLIEIIDEFKLDPHRSLTKLHNSLTSQANFGKLLETFVQIICTYITEIEVPKDHALLIRRRLISVLLLYGRASLIQEYQKFSFN